MTVPNLFGEQMRAKIQYTVNIDEIPQEVFTRMTPIYYKSESTAREIQDVLKDINEGNILQSLEKIDKVRKDLSFYDSILEDSYNILIGYVNYQTKQMQKQTEPQAEEQQEVTNE